MSIFSAMSTGVSGLAGQSKKFQTISDNVSNIGTTGYKATKMDFSSLVVESAMATAYAPGSLLARPRREIDAQGTIQVTNRATDAAISGNGFFAVRSDPASTSIEFTRAGKLVERARRGPEGRHAARRVDVGQLHRGLALGLVHQVFASNFKGDLLTEDEVGRQSNALEFGLRIDGARGRASRGAGSRQARRSW